jgi:hypothetical protein
VSPPNEGMLAIPPSIMAGSGHVPFASEEKFAAARAHLDTSNANLFDEITVTARSGKRD